MSLIDQLSKGFSSSARRKGHDYARAKRVMITSGDSWNIEASVRGTQTYDVRIHRDEDEMFVSCTCPHFYSGYICKHLWAVLLEADQNQFLGGDGSGPVSLIADLPVLDEYDSFENENYVGNIIPHALKASQMPRGWRQQLGFSKEPPRIPAEPWPTGRRLVYVIDTSLTLENQILTLDVLAQDPKKDGELGKPRTVRIPLAEIPRISDRKDREILGILSGSIAAAQNDYYSSGHSLFDTASSRYRIRPPLTQFLLPLLCRTERLFLKTRDGVQVMPLRWDEGDPWRFLVQVRRSETEPRRYDVRGYLRRENNCIDLSAPALLLSDGLVFFPQEAALLDHGNAFSWISALRSHSPITVPEKQITDFLTDTFSQPYPPKLDLPEELAFEEIVMAPRPCLAFPSKHSSTRLHAHLSYEYGGPETMITFHEDDRRAAAFDATMRKSYRRDTGAESEAQQQLQAAGFRYVSQGYYDSRSRWEIGPKHFPYAVRELTAQGWKVEAEGKLFRSPGALSIRVSSGIDWFELHGTVEYGEISLSLPKLLAAEKRGDSMVLLSDGSFGILPEDWLKKYATFMSAGKSELDYLRFQRSQIGLLDALLAAQPEAQVDQTFAKARKELLHFEGIREIAPPKTFHGTLRHYQKIGLGWLRFLRRFGFGGILADDMGLGKTVTILALLEERRKLRQKSAREGESAPPSLVVVPTSLVFNWKLEASRFTPNLRVLDHTGVSRRKETEHFGDYDLVLTTYGTLRNDAVLFKDRSFDYIILDEAQTIKNAQTAAAKAARLLKGKHKLALSGTPVENHLGELWSLFEFLNPGMLGAARVFKMTGSAARNPDDQTRKLLAQALRPFILRRTKQQVLQELPPKTEQTIYCELHPGQRKLYDELRKYYHDMLLSRVDTEGINKSKIYVLEALLRLRQAACHVGLIDPMRTQEPATKLEMLLPQLKEVLEEGHKVLVFSQFTSFLAVLRQRLEKDGIPYEYLDGQTTDRQTPVEKFQNHPDSRLFLISLKAGGLGLNLTAAEYVYLLDPWWNPVAEAQAIDRAHRIGQQRSVFAYRLIAQNTVEEKVLELQKTKRELADAIINADNSLIRNLAREDLELLLS